MPTRLNHAAAAAALKSNAGAVQVAHTALESTLLKWSVKDYLLRAGICHLASGEISDAVTALERYQVCDCARACHTVRVPADDLA